MECIVNKTVKHVGISSVKIKNVVGDVLKQIKKSQVQVSVNLIGDQKMQRLNRVYHKQDKITDVLSFAVQDGKHIIDSKEVDLGDLFICIPQIKRQAKKEGVSFKEEMVRMIVHGILHLAGYDHHDKSTEKEMFGLQERLVKKNKI